MRVGARPGLLQGPVRGRVRGSPVFLDRAAVPWASRWAFQFGAAGSGLGARGEGGCRRWRSGLRWYWAVEQVLVQVRRLRTEERKELCVCPLAGWRNMVLGPVCEGALGCVREWIWVQGRKALGFHSWILSLVPATSVPVVEGGGSRDR